MLFFLAFLLSMIIIIPTLIVNVSGLNTLFTSPSPKKSRTPDSNILSPTKESTPSAGLHLGWTGNQINSNSLARYKGLNIISTAAGSIDNQFHLHLSTNPLTNEMLRKQNQQVWARITMGQDVKQTIHQLFTNPTKTDSLIKNLNQAAFQNHWDGVNIDIENVSSQDRNTFSQFIKSLSSALHQSHVILSIDIPPDAKGGNDSSPFDHQVLGQYCDYVALMGYDEHWSTDPNPGPITSLPWLTDGITELIQTGIPSHKIILGLPAYTRIWKQNQAGKITANPAYPFRYVEQQLLQNHRLLTWDPQLDEYYASYRDSSNNEYKIWLTNVKSLQLYLALVSKYQLAGSAIWNLDMMDANTWNTLY